MLESQDEGVYDDVLRIRFLRNCSPYMGISRGNLDNAGTDFSPEQISIDRRDLACRRYDNS